MLIVTEWFLQKVTHDSCDATTCAQGSVSWKKRTDLHKRYFNQLEVKQNIIDNMGPSKLFTTIFTHNAIIYHNEIQSSPNGDTMGNVIVVESFQIN